MLIFCVSWHSCWIWKIIFFFITRIIFNFTQIDLCLWRFIKRVITFVWRWLKINLYFSNLASFDLIYLFFLFRLALQRVQGGILFINFFLYFAVWNCITTQCKGREIIEVNVDLFWSDLFLFEMIFRRIL